MQQLGLEAQMLPTPSPLGPKSVPCGRISDRPISEIDQLIEYYYCAKFGAFNQNCTIFPHVLLD